MLLQVGSLRIINCALVLVFAAAQLSARPALAVMVNTDTVVSAEKASAGRGRVHGFLAREDVRTQLKLLGVSPDEASARVASLSDQEIARIDARLNELPAGGSVAGVAITLLVVLVLILVITDLLGLTDVFSFISPLPRSSSR
jgi:uncharacterized small protein (DUF1192 family)